ncbi:hypothetical protein VTG60DRAFT_3994 [Thermothelomyces hinnuleus]
MPCPIGGTRECGLSLFDTEFSALLSHDADVLSLMFPVVLLRLLSSCFSRYQYRVIDLYHGPFSRSPSLASPPNPGWTRITIELFALPHPYSHEQVPARPLGIDRQDGKVSTLYASFLSFPRATPLHGAPGHAELALCLGMPGLARSRRFGSGLLHDEEFGHYLRRCRLLERCRHQVQEVHDLPTN